MKLIILRDNLKTGLDTVSKALGIRTNLPVLSGVLIRAKGNQIKLSTTNLELALTEEVFGKVIEEGELVVPHSVFSNMVNNLSTERVNLESKNNNLIVKTDNYEASIQGTDSKEFPIIPSIKNRSEKIEIEGSVFREALSKTVIAAEISDLRPEISGVLLTIEPSEFKLVATDSFRLAEATIFGKQVKNSFNQGTKTTIPLKAAQELVRVVDDKDTINLFLDESQILFESGGVELISRAIEGKFPDYQAIVPKEIETEVLIERAELINGVKLAGSFSGRSNEMTLSIKDKKVLELSSSDSGLGENKYKIPAKINGPEMEVIFNWQYLLDGIRNESSKEVILGLNGEERPTLIKSPEGSSYFYILMPIKP